MLCRDFKERANRKLVLDIDSRAFLELFNIWCSMSWLKEIPLGKVMMLASVADRLEMLDVGTALEDEIMKELSVVCVERC